jgi:hypothetical protein
MNEIFETISSSYKRNLMAKKIIHKVLHKDILDLYELNSYKKLTFNKRLQNIIDVNTLQTEKYDLKTINHLQNLYLSHRYDILGSGWVYVSQGSNINENSIKLENKKRNCALSLSDDYKPINWNIDLKTNFEFSKDDIYKEGRITGVPNRVDVKVCWDLARMYHLVLLSIFTLVTKNKENILEFKNQVIDFYINNPIGYGINWCGSMNASIRASNLLIAYDIFKQIDEENVLDNDFDNFFSSFIYQHGRFIINNLEADILHGKSHNHYLSNIVGLLYISAYLNDKTSNKWWNFARKEFFREINKQFFEDGGNFEGSTSYHRFSGEMFVYGLAIIKRSTGHVPDNLIDKLWKAAYFSKSITKSSDKIVQIGDNDSGRFFKFTIIGEFVSSKEAEEKYLNLNGYTEQYGGEEFFFDENFLNHDSFIASVAGLIDTPEFTNEKNKYPLEFSLVKSISHSNIILNEQVVPEIVIANNHLDCSKFSTIITNTIILEEEPSINKNGKWTVFEEFGLFCYKSDIINFYIYGGRKNKSGINSHIHNDKLHFEFSIKDKEFFCDPGTGVYTSNSEWREMFRGYKMHNVPDYGFGLDKEKSIFSMEEKSHCELVNLDKNTISLLLSTDTIRHLRKVTINEKSLIIEDHGTHNFDVNLEGTEYFSNGYGKVMDKKKKIYDLEIIKTKRSQIVD